MKRVKGQDLEPDDFRLVKDSLPEFGQLEMSLIGDIQNPHHIFFIEKGIGYVSGIVLFEELEIIRVYILPEKRNQGYGKRLLQAIFQAGNFKRVLLEVRESNRVAQRLYQSLRFDVIGVRANYYHQPREDALIMERKLLDE